MEKQKSKILVIEDDQVLQVAIIDKLRMCGFEAIIARTKDEGVNALEENDKVDLIWLDHYLFGQEDGLDFLNEVRHNKKWRDIPIFVISNTASRDKVTTYLALGADKYYTKADHRLEEIINDIKGFLNNQ